MESHFKFTGTPVKEEQIIIMDIHFIYDNWRSEADFMEEMSLFPTIKEKFDYIMKHYGQKYYKEYGKYPTLGVKAE